MTDAQMYTYAKRARRYSKNVMGLGWYFFLWSLLLTIPALIMELTGDRFDATAGWICWSATICSLGVILWQRRFWWAGIKLDRLVSSRARDLRTVYPPEPDPPKPKDDPALTELMQRGLADRTAVAKGKSWACGCSKSS